MSEKLTLNPNANAQGPANQTQPFEIGNQQTQGMQVIDDPTKKLIMPNQPEQNKIVLVDKPLIDTPANQELKTQRDIMGHNGLGSIRNEYGDRGDAKEKDSEKEDGFAKEALNPLNILDLKERYDRRLSYQSSKASSSLSLAASLILSALSSSGLKVFA